MSGAPSGVIVSRSPDHPTRHGTFQLRETGQMRYSSKEITEKKDTSETCKKPYQPPSLTLHGDVAEITKVLRSARAKGTISSDIT